MLFIKIFVISEIDRAEYFAWAFARAGGRDGPRLLALEEIDESAQSDAVNAHATQHMLHKYVDERHAVR